jgi:hypothetical protein
VRPPRWTQGRPGAVRLGGVGRKDRLQWLFGNPRTAQEAEEKLVESGRASECLCESDCTPNGTASWCNVSSCDPSSLGIRNTYLRGVHRSCDPNLQGFADLLRIYDSLLAGLDQLANQPMSPELAGQINLTRAMLNESKSSAQAAMSERTSGSIYVVPPEYLATLNRDKQSVDQLENAIYAPAAAPSAPSAPAMLAPPLVTTEAAQREAEVEAALVQQAMPKPLQIAQGRVLGRSQCPCTSECTNNGEDSWCFVADNCRTRPYVELKTAFGVARGYGRYCDPAREGPPAAPAAPPLTVPIAPQAPTAPPLSAPPIAPSAPPLTPFLAASRAPAASAAPARAPFYAPQQPAIAPPARITGTPFTSATPFGFPAPTSAVGFQPGSAFGTFGAWPEQTVSEAEQAAVQNALLASLGSYAPTTTTTSAYAYPQASQTLGSYGYGTYGYGSGYGAGYDWPTAAPSSYGYGYGYGAAVPQLQSFAQSNPYAPYQAPIALSNWYGGVPGWF